MAISSLHGPSQNHLLAALPAAEFEALAAHLELVPLPLGKMLYEPGTQLQHAYFPTTAIVSLHYVMEVRRMLEGQAVRLACTRRTADNIREITAILEETNKRLSKKQSIEREDEAFHLAIFAATKNDILLRVARSFYELSRHRRKVYFADQNRGRQSYEDHCTILEAIEERRVGLAEQQMNAHLSRTVEAWQSLLGETKVTKR